MAVISNEGLLTHVNAVSNIEGDFCEIGVFRGDTFKRLAPLARHRGRRAHGFDSFCGMDDPTDLDFGYYDKGRLSVGGVEAFCCIMDPVIQRTEYDLFEGFIPTCFEAIKPTQRYALVIVDVDQYAPTVTSLDWVWPLVTEGGIVILDDYFKNREGLAAMAIDEFLAALHPLDFQFLEYTNTQLIIRKQHIPDRPLK